MYHQKKIALFISHIYGEYQTHLTRGVVEHAASLGYQTEVYTTNDGENLGNYLVGENSILQIPNYDTFEGIVFASNTYFSPQMKEQILEKLKTLAGIPIVEINDNDPFFPNVMLENNRTAGDLTRHLIEVHGCRRICYLGCKWEERYSVQRLDYYRDVMQRHSLPVQEQDIFICDESPASYQEALRTFTADGTDIPDAVVCYNDRLALRFWSEALGMGIRIPDQMAIVGCDDSYAGQNVTPQLTTVSYPVSQMGVAAVDTILQMRHGKPAQTVVVTAEPLYRGSCGCSYHKGAPSYLYSQQLIEKIGDTEQSILQSIRMSSILAKASSVEEGMDLLETFVPQLTGISGFFVCLHSDWDRLSKRILKLTNSDDQTPEKDDATLLKLAIQDGKRLAECTFSRKTLLPDFLLKNSDDVRIVSSLFYEKRCFGYVVLSFQNNQLHYPFKLVQWLMNISQFLESLLERRGADAMTSHLEEIYLKDVLTGLYNRHGFDKYAQIMLDALPDTTPVSLLFFDLDGLKNINDQFGHQEGDFALKVAGQALKRAAQGNELCAKYGGDEFYVFLIGDEEAAHAFIHRVNRYLDHYSQLSNKGYTVSVSAGSATCPHSDLLGNDDLKRLLSRADEKMYQNKKQKKASLTK